MHPSSITIGIENISFGKNTLIKAGTLLDSSNGPIIIDENSIIGNGAILEGPVYVGKNSVISAGALIKENVVIGPTCKVGGEVTSTIFQGFSSFFVNSRPLIESNGTVRPAKPSVRDLHRHPE